RSRVRWAVLVLSLDIRFEHQQVNCGESHDLRDAAAHGEIISLCMIDENRAISLFNLGENVFLEGRKVKWGCFTNHHSGGSARTQGTFVENSKVNTSLPKSATMGR